MTSVPKIIRTAKAERDLSLRQIKANAEAAGHSLGLSTLQRYETGTAATYSRSVLTAIAVGLGIHPEALLAAADIPTLGEPFELPDEAALLAPHEREAVRSVVNAFIQNRRQRPRPTDLSVIGGGMNAAAEAYGADEDQDDYELAASYGDEGISPDEDPHTT